MSLDLPDTGYCGEEISGTCTATLSSRLTLDISGRRSYTFTPDSTPKSVQIEGVSLRLVELEPTRDKFKFVVSITYTLEEALTISCRNDEVDEKHQVMLQSNTYNLQYPTPHL